MKSGRQAALAIACAVAFVAGPAAQTIQINGAGATFPYPIYKAQSKAMVDFVKWALTVGQQYCAELGYAPLPESVVKLEMAALAKVKIS